LFEQAKKEIALLINQFKTQRGKSQLITQKSLGELRNRILRGLEPKEGLDIKVTSQLKVGDLVRHGGFGQTGTIVKLSDQKALVQFSGMKAEVALSSLELVEGSEAKGYQSPLSKWDLGGPFVLELNVIGKRVPEAISMVEKAINRALVEGRDELRIVHGHGTGQLRRAIREHLSQYPHVKGLRSEDPSLGGEAVTIVEL
ncbi:MAG: Smr/MutS family protein, partial [Desulfatiglandales bacterium]